MTYIDHDLYSILGESLRDARDLADLTLTDVASMLKVSPMTVQRYEKAERKATVETIRKLCEIYSVDADDLMQRSIDRFRSISSSDISDGLSSSEQHLISCFRSLNDGGKQKILDYASDLLASRLYL